MRFNSIILFISFYSLHSIQLSNGSASRTIPDNLINCYRNNGYNITSPKTVQTLIEILSRIERNNNYYNMRILSTSLLHQMRIDGIERAIGVKETEFIIPYRASGFQYNKYSFLLDLLIPGENLIDLKDTPQSDLCVLHFLLSSTIDQWERGDEFRICPLNMNNFIRNPPFSQPFINRTRKLEGLSRCPIEKGVMKTFWGDVSAGTLLGAISAALEPQNVVLKDILESMPKTKGVEDDIDYIENEFFGEDFQSEITNALMTSEKYISNVFAATIAGDLAEVIVRQGPYVSINMQKFIFGSWTKWNDSALPRDLYLMQEPPFNWEMTNAEILGGIDGFIIANFLNDWRSEFLNLRLSQVIEMYYSNAGVAFNNNIKACNRKNLFSKLMVGSDILEQTTNLAHFLWLRTGFVYAPPKEIERLSEIAVKEFENYWPKLLDTLPGCPNLETTNPVEAVVVTDGSWTKYQTEQFISLLAESFDVSYHGSRMGLLHGNTGEWISYPTHNVIELFDNITNYTNKWTSRLDYPVVLTTIINRLENITQEEALTFNVVDLSRVVVVAAPMTKLSKVDLEKSSTIMSSIRSNYMDVYFTYYMKDEEGFNVLAIDPQKYSDVLINENSINVAEVAEKIRFSLVKMMMPKRFLPPPCELRYSSSKRHEYEDYISVGKTNVYRIHPNFMTYTKSVSVQFQGTDHGEISVCVSRKFTTEDADSCKILSNTNDVNFEISQPCNGNAFCNPIYFLVEARSAYIKCSDKDCRFPNQIRYIVRHNGLECLTGNYNSGSTAIYKRCCYIDIMLLLTIVCMFFI